MPPRPSSHLTKRKRACTVLSMNRSQHTEISQEAVERVEPYEHPELGAQMRPCQTLGGYVTFTDYENLVESYEAMKRARTDALRQRDDAQAQVLAEVANEFEAKASNVPGRDTWREAAEVCRVKALATLNPNEGEDDGES